MQSVRKRYKDNRAMVAVPEEYWVDHAHTTKELFDKLISCLPYAPCPYCVRLGENTSACVCLGRGWLDEKTYGECLSDGRPIGIE